VRPEPSPVLSSTSESDYRGCGSVRTGLSGSVGRPEGIDRSAQWSPDGSASEGSGDADVGSPRVWVEVVTTTTRSVAIEFRIQSGTIEVWYRNQCSAIFDRARMRAWLAHPVRWLAEGEVVFSVDPRSDGERIAVNLPDVLAWTLSPKEQLRLTERVSADGAEEADPSSHKLTLGTEG
jgi:hypothetical protein